MMLRSWGQSRRPTSRLPFTNSVGVEETFSVLAWARDLLTSAYVAFVSMQRPSCRASTSLPLAHSMTFSLKFSGVTPAWLA